MGTPVAAHVGAPVAAHAGAPVAAHVGVPVAAHICIFFCFVECAAEDCFNHARKYGP